MASALILGGTGQIGRATARRLAETGWDVTVAARGERPKVDDVRFVRVDRTAAGELEAAVGDGVDVLIDIIPLRVEDGEQLRALRGRVGSVVAISTAGVYVDDEGRGFADADVAYRVPVTERHATAAPGDADYHSRKRAIEIALLEHDDLRATVIRPCAIHGPHGKRLREWHFVRRALDGRRFVVLARRGCGRFHTTSVDNLAEVIRLAAQRPAARVLNCGDPEPPTVLEIGRTIAAAMDVEWAEVLLPGAEQDTVGDHPWNTARPFVLDMTSAAIELGYKPVTTYERAVVRTIEWLTSGEAPELDGLFDYEAEDRFLAGLGS